MNDALIVSLLSAVPKNPAARAMGGAARTRLPRFLHRALVRWFVRKYGVDLSECKGTIDDFDTLADFFVRELKEGVRTIDPSPDVLVSPVDATVHTVGEIQGNSFVQAEGRLSGVGKLIGVGDPRTPGVSPEEATRYDGGSFTVLYLSPKDYHRVHTPREGRVVGYRYLPGQLWPVFAAATARVADLFAVNERMVYQIETDMGLITEVLVGAFGVGHMSSSICDVRTNTTGLGAVVNMDPHVDLPRAAEIGRFELGSTVILLMAPNQVEWLIKPGQPVRLGQPIARRRRDPEVLETEEV